jgi:hypothetical protein
MQSVDKKGEAEISYSTLIVDSLTRQPVDGIEMNAVFKKRRSTMREPKSLASNVRNNASNEGTCGMGDGHVPFVM